MHGLLISMASLLPLLASSCDVASLSLSPPLLPNPTNVLFDFNFILNCLIIKYGFVN